MIEFPPVPAGEPLVISATLYMTYTRCPDQALGRLRGLYPAESKASFKGGLAHRVFARHLNDGAISEESFAQVCRQEIGSGMNPQLGSLGLKPSQLSGVIQEVNDLYTKFKVLSTAGFSAAEVLVEVEPQPDLVLRGSIDAVFAQEDGVRLVDWKTGGLYETEQQLGFYAMLWALAKGRLPAAVEAVSIGSGERIRAGPSAQDIAATVQEVAGLATVMRTAFGQDREQIDRFAGPWCRYCPQLDTCPEGAAAARLT